ncbi:uncharacterized protein STEHIDRAFT_168254 [Stereum hirsutum FP-91666 SS1]|uniref:uncharacterized protein n=1 Tax=Stereum hirsutum (strain FP-91666) TaxID=721885 RepID=UPI000440CB45|nr:uncharacterized protein STEHIDRAFT_168254 [Stereum hirsutum FP-91666 SS1]EIM87536.1 hypothetical protein STEHIDRAFT_168254 [Stereum hirsutum FP-91666 SS1]
MPQVPLAPVELGAIVVESLFMGAYLVTFAVSVHFLFFKRFRHHNSARSTPRSPMTIICLVLFLCIMAHWILDIIRLFDAFISKKSDPVAFYSVLSDGKNVARSFLYNFETFCADSIMAYRLYHVWGRSLKICILPVLTTSMIAIAGIGITVQFASIQPNIDVFTSECGRWITTLFSATLITNVYSSTLIAYRIWKSHTAVKQSKFGWSAAVPRAIHIVVESAAIYTACTLITFIAYLVESNIQYAAFDATSPVIGFVFCLIIVRVQVTKTTASRSDAETRAYPMQPIHPVMISIESEVVSDGRASYKGGDCDANAVADSTSV